MTRYLLRRVLQSAVIIPVVILLTFVMVWIAPGDPAAVLAGDMADPQYVEVLRERLGLDRPFWEQLYRYGSRVVRGDLGYSFAYSQPVVTLILGRLPATVLLMGSGLIIAAVLGLIFGTIAAFKPHTVLDSVTTMGSLFAYSFPVFWLGMMLIILFAVQLGWLPTGGIISLRTEAKLSETVFDVLKHLALPAFSLGLRHMAVTARLVRARVLEEIRSDYVRTARSKGLSETSVFFRHALRNALLPVVTTWGLRLGVMLSGAVLTETVFSWPGLGRLMFEALSFRDYPVLIGMLIATSIMVAFANLTADLLYAVLDPRVRYA